MATRKKGKVEPKPEYKPGSFHTAVDAYNAGKQAKLSGQYQNDSAAYESHENNGGNLHAKQDFKMRFMTGYNSVGRDTITT